MYFFKRRSNKSPFKIQECLPTTDTSLFLATYRGWSHLPADIASHFLTYSKNIHVFSYPRPVPCFGTMNITAKRNAYGRQLGSFHTDAEFDGLGQVLMTFIRAPYIAQAGEGVEILAEVDGKIVAARQGRQLVTAFHPELDGDTRIHEYFLNM